MRHNGNGQVDKLIVRIKGGLGNQLFCYAAARRLALVNDAELVIDDVTGFLRDQRYGRQSELGHFNIPVRRATPSERMEPFERLRRGLAKRKARKKAFGARQYIEEGTPAFDERILNLKIKGPVYFDGLWQDEAYFADVEQIVRRDLEIIPPTDPLNQSIANEIRATNSVAVHVRWFDKPGEPQTHNIAKDYYRRAIDSMDSKTVSPEYFVFSDDPNSVPSKILRDERVNIVSHNCGDKDAYADLWLMSQCRHFIIANSTFSWWGAWFGAYQGKIVVSPALETGTGAMRLAAKIPSSWLKV